MAKLNLHRIKSELNKLLTKKYTLNDFNFEYEDNRLLANNSLTVKGYKGDVYALVKCYEYGECAVEFIFDKLEGSPTVNTLLAEFNKKSYWFGAFIGSKGYLELRYTVATVTNTDDFIKNVDFAFSKLVSDDTQAIFGSLTQLTHE